MTETKRTTPRELCTDMETAIGDLNSCIQALHTLSEHSQNEIEGYLRIRGIPDHEVLGIMASAGGGEVTWAFCQAMGLAEKIYEEWRELFEAFNKEDKAAIPRAAE